MKKPANKFLASVVCILLAASAIAALAQAAGPATVPQTRPSWTAYSESPRRDFLSSASDNRFWIARVEKPVGAAPGEEETQLMYHEPFSPEWTLAQSVLLRAITMAAQDDQLFIAFDNGQLMITDGQDLRLGTPPGDGGKIIALANNQGSIWSLVSVSSSATTVPSATQPSTQIASTQPFAPAGLYLERLDGGQWMEISKIPLEGVVKADQISLMVNKDQALVAWQNSPRSVAVGSWKIRAKDEWSSDGSAVVAQDILAFKLLWAADQPELWVAGNQTSATANSSSTQPATLAQAGEIFSGVSFSHIVTVPVSGPALPISSAQTAEIAQGRFRWLADNNGKIYEQADDMAGHTSEELKPIASPSPQQIPLMPCAEAAAGMIALSAVAAVIQKKDESARPKPDTSEVKTEAGAAKLPLAQPGARFAAALVDLVPIVAAIGAWRQANMDNPGMVDPHSVLNILILAAITYLAHTLISELICAQTIGKMLFGTRVVTTSGAKPKAWNIIIRNVFRTADFAVLPLLTVLLTPMHQRLGDILGNTTVISIDEPETPKRDSQE